jgi:hypothetical protein
MHLFGQAFDHDYDFELLHEEARGTHSIARRSISHHRLFRAVPRANRTLSPARNPISCASSTTAVAALPAPDKLIAIVEQSGFPHLDRLIHYLDRLIHLFGGGGELCGARVKDNDDLDAQAGGEADLTVVWFCSSSLRTTVPTALSSQTAPFEDPVMASLGFNRTVMTEC